MGHKQILPLQARVDLGVMVMKDYSTFFKVRASPADAVSCHTQNIKQFQVFLSNTNNSSQDHLFSLHMVKGFQVLLSNTNDSI